MTRYANSDTDVKLVLAEKPFASHISLNIQSIFIQYMKASHTQKQVNTPKY